MLPRFFAAMFALVALSTGCGMETEAGKSANAKLALANGTGTGSALADATCPDLGGGFRGDTCYTPILYGMKILQVYVSTDAQGATTSPAGLIWANPDCPLTTSTSEKDGKSYDYESASGCDETGVTTFFELARPTAEVNAALNSQPHKLLPGTYNYVQMSFCIGGAKTKNVQFQTSDMASPYQVTSNACGITSAKADPPITVGEDASVTVSLSYSLTNVIYTKAEMDNPAECYSSENGATLRCFGFPTALMPALVQ
jgi:hypothetical protein